MFTVVVMLIEKICSGIVLKVVSSIKVYNTNNDTMIVDRNLDHNDIGHGVLGVDLFNFHNHLYRLSQHLIYKYSHYH